MWVISRYECPQNVVQTQSEEYEQQKKSRRKLEASFSPFEIFVWLQEIVLAPGQQAFLTDLVEEDWR